MLSTIEEICTKTLWIDNGRLMDFDTTDKVVNAYTDFMKRKGLLKEKKNG